MKTLRVAIKAKVEGLSVETIASASERTPEGIVPLTSFIQNLSELRFAVQVA
jgi:hypothetical protein